MALAIRVGRPFDEVVALDPRVTATYMQVLEDQAEREEAERGR